MNVDRYKKDLNALIKKGDLLLFAIQYECYPQETARTVEDSFGSKDEADAMIQTIPSFKDDYQPWYSEAKALVKQLLPDRLSDFTRYYEKPKTRKGATYENYTVEDYLQGLTVTRGINTVVEPSAAIPIFRQQLNIVKSIRERFESSLFDIRQLAQADLFDSELEAAAELAKNRFERAAGAMAGVVLERHLKEVCDFHAIRIRKRTPTLADFNNALKESNVIDTPQWRSIQQLGDVRNMCAHDKESEPTAEQVKDLLAGVSKVTRTVF